MNDLNASTPTASNKKRWRYSTLRRILLAAAFLLLLVNPLLNYYWGIAFIQGWYQSLGIGELRLVSPLEGLESLLVSKQAYTPALMAMIVPLVLAALLGRVFCSWICPISFLAEMLAEIRRRIGKRTVLRDRLVLAKRLLWFALIGELLLSLILGAPLFVFLSPARPGGPGADAGRLFSQPRLGRPVGNRCSGLGIVDTAILLPLLLPPGWTAGHGGHGPPDGRDPGRKPLYPLWPLRSRLSPGAHTQCRRIAFALLLELRHLHRQLRPWRPGIYLAQQPRGPIEKSDGNKVRLWIKHPRPLIEEAAVGHDKGPWQGIPPGQHIFPAFFLPIPYYKRN